MGIAQIQEHIHEIHEYPLTPDQVITVYLCVWLALFGLVLGLFSVAAGPQLLGLFTPDPAVIESGMIRLFIVNGPYFICGVMDVMTGALRGIGYSMLPMIVSLIGSCALRIVWVMTVFAAAPSMASLMISYPISWGLTFIALVAIFVPMWRKLRREYTPQELAQR